MRAGAGVLRMGGLGVIAARVIALLMVGGGIVGGGLLSVSARASVSSCPNAALRVAASARVSDCRVYEQVSPVDKGGFAAYPATSPPAQVSLSGEALAYLNYQAFPGSVGNTAVGSAHVSIRSSDGWQTAEWTPRIPEVVPIPEVLKSYTVDYTFSSDLTQAIVQTPSIPLTPDAAPWVQNLYHRHSEGTYSLVNSNPPKVPAEAICAPKELKNCWMSADVSGFAGASSDFSHVLFESNAQFIESAPETGIESLYENSGGVVSLVGILPDGVPAATSTAGAGSSAFYTSSFQEADRSVERAVSEDGSQVIFQAPADGGEPDPEQGGLTEVYDRIDGTETIEISAPAPGATPAVSTAGPATFQTASVDGSQVFFTSSAELTTQSNTGEANNSEDLYEYNLETQQLTDLTIDTNPLDAATGAMVQGVIDSSTDGSYVYFVANGQLIEGKGIDGQPNLYMLHNGGKPVFVATLGSGGECRFIADPCVWSSFPAVREAYVTPDGRHLAFMSSRSLSTVNFPGGYDNTDQETGQADSEVYEYTAPSKPEGTGQLLCASCDPTGVQPVGKALLGGISPGVAVYGSISTAFYRVRALSDNGQRLFYAAPASVSTPYDSVFEYEHDGEGTCEDARGCQTLISSPDNTEADYFLGSSADGSDVFIATSSQLAPTDQDALRDVYDARVDGGFPTLPAKAPCESGCHTPAPPISTSSLASLVTAPSGNVRHQVPPKCAKKRFKLSHGKCVKVKKKKKKKKKKKHSESSTGRAKSTRESRRAR